MRRRSLGIALAALAPLLLVAVARAEEEDPFAETPPGKELPPLPPLPELAPLPELLPIAVAPAPAHRPVPDAPAAPSPAQVTPPPTPTLLALPAVSSAVLGQYDEYTRPLAAFSIDANPVGVGEYQRCVVAGKCTKPSCAVGRREARVTCVDLEQAKSYCAFAGERLPTEEEWEHAARQAGGTAGMRSIDDAAEWTSSPYCFFCGKDDQVVRGGPARNPALRGWRPPATHDASVGFRCAKSG